MTFDPHFKINAHVKYIVTRASPYQHPHDACWYKLGSEKGNHTSHSVVTSSSGIRNMKQNLQSRFLHYVAPYLLSGILPLTDYGTNIKSLHTIAVFGSVLFNNRILRTASPKIAPEEANLPRPYRSTLS